MNETVDQARAPWFKSSYSNGQSSCVEIAFLDGDTVALRDTKHEGRGPVMAFASAGWASFLDSAASGEFDRP